jgi:hypothetical protein
MVDVPPLTVFAGRGRLDAVPGTPAPDDAPDVSSVFVLFSITVCSGSYFS